MKPFLTILLLLMSAISSLAKDVKIEVDATFLFEDCSQPGEDGDTDYHFSSYSFTTLNPESKTKKYFVGWWLYESELKRGLDRWKKVEGLEHRTKVRVQILPKSKDTKESIRKEEEVVFIDPDEFIIVKIYKGEQDGGHNSGSSAASIVTP